MCSCNHSLELFLIYFTLNWESQLVRFCFVLLLYALTLTLPCDRLIDRSCTCQLPFNISLIKKIIFVFPCNCFCFLACSQVKSFGSLISEHPIDNASGRYFPRAIAIIDQLVSPRLLRETKLDPLTLLSVNCAFVGRAAYAVRC